MKADCAEKAMPTINSMQEDVLKSLLQSGMVTSEHFSRFTCSTVLLATRGSREVHVYHGLDSGDSKSYHRTNFRINQVGKSKLTKLVS